MSNRHPEPARGAARAVKRPAPAEIVEAAAPPVRRPWLRPQPSWKTSPLPLYRHHGGPIYLYFPTKEDLFRTVVRQAVLPNLEAAEALLLDPDAPASDILRAIAERFLLLLDTDLTAIPKLVVAESGNFPAIARFYAEEVILKGMALIRGVLARGIERGEFRPIDLDGALPLFSAPMLLLLLWKLPRWALPRPTSSSSPGAVVATHLDVLLRGLAPDPRP